MASVDATTSGTQNSSPERPGSRASIGNDQISGKSGSSKKGQGQKKGPKPSVDFVEPESLPPQKRPQEAVSADSHDDPEEAGAASALSSLKGNGSMTFAWVPSVRKKRTKQGRGSGLGLAVPSPPPTSRSPLPPASPGFPSAFNFGSPGPRKRKGGTWRCATADFDEDEDVGAQGRKSAFRPVTGRPAEEPSSFRGMRAGSLVGKGPPSTTQSARQPSGRAPSPSGALPDASSPSRGPAGGSPRRHAASSPPLSLHSDVSPDELGPDIDSMHVVHNATVRGGTADGGGGISPQRPLPGAERPLNDVIISASPLSQPLTGGGKVASPLRGRKDVLQWPTNPEEARVRLRRLYSLLSQIHDPNILTGDALQGALAYANTVEVVVGGEPGGAPSQKCNMAALIDQALEHAGTLKDGMQAFQELMDRAREAVGQGPNSAAALCQQAVARLEAVMTGARKAMEGLARIELATAGCLESSFEQLSHLAKHAEALITEGRLRERLVTVDQQRQVISAAFAMTSVESNECLEVFESLRAVMVDVMDVRAQLSGAKERLESSQSALVQAGARTLNTNRLKEGKVATVVERDALHQYTVLRIVQNIQVGVKTSLAESSISDIKLDQLFGDDPGQVSQQAAAITKQMYEWWSSLSSFLNKVVLMANLPEALTAEIARQHFQTAVGGLPRSVRSQMQVAAQSCRVQGLLMKMDSEPNRPLAPRVAALALSQHLAAMTSTATSSPPLALAAAASALAPAPQQVRGMLSAPAAVTAAWQQGREQAAAGEETVKPTGVPAPAPPTEGQRSEGPGGSRWGHIHTGQVHSAQENSTFETLHGKPTQWAGATASEGGPSATGGTWGGPTLDTHDSTHFSGLAYNGFDTQTSYASGQIPSVPQPAALQWPADARAVASDYSPSRLAAAGPVAPHMLEQVLANPELISHLLTWAAAASDPAAAARAHAPAASPTLHLPHGGLPTQTWPAAPLTLGAPPRPRGPALPGWNSAKDPITTSNVIGHTLQAAVDRSSLAPPSGLTAAGLQEKLRALLLERPVEGQGPVAAAASPAEKLRALLEGRSVEGQALPAGAASPGDNSLPRMRSLPALVNPAVASQQGQQQRAPPLKVALPLTLPLLDPAGQQAEAVKLLEQYMRDGALPELLQHLERLKQQNPNIAMSLAQTLVQSPHLPSQLPPRVENGVAGPLADAAAPSSGV